jgi:peptide chain release factor subunit 1
MGEVGEFGRVRSEGVPGRHKKGGWFALSQNHYARHIERLVSMHLKEVLGRIEGFLASEKVDTLILGGSAEAVATFNDMLPKGIKSMVRGVFDSGMGITTDELFGKVEPIVNRFEAHRRDEEVGRLVSGPLRNDHTAVETV